MGVTVWGYHRLRALFFRAIPDAVEYVPRGTLLEDGAGVNCVRVHCTNGQARPTDQRLIIRI